MHETTIANQLTDVQENFAVIEEEANIYGKQSGNVIDGCDVSNKVNFRNREDMNRNIEDEEKELVHTAYNTRESNKGAKEIIDNKKTVMGAVKEKKK